MTEMEKDLFTWAYDLTLSVIEAVIEKSKKKSRKAMEDAIAAGLEYLSEEETERVICDIRDFFVNTNGDDFPDRPKRRSNLKTF